MKKIFLFSFLLFGLVISAQQTFVLNPAMVDPDDAENFEMLIKKYGKEMAQDAVDN